MNKLFTKIAAVVLGATMAVGVGVAVAVGGKANEVKAAVPSDQTITFLSSGTGDSSTSYATNTSISDILSGSDAFSGVRYVSKAYKGKASGGGMKLGASSGGNIGFALATGYTQNIKRIVVSFAQWGTDTSTVTLLCGTNGSSDTADNSQDSGQATVNSTTTSNSITKTFTTPTTLTTIGFSSNKREYVKTLTIHYEETGSSISLDKYSEEIDEHESFSLTATATGLSGTLTWKTGNSSVASISSTTGNQITVTGEAPGTTKITAYDSNNENLKAECSVTVNEIIVPTGVTISGAQSKVGIYESFDVSAVVTAASGTPSQDVIWSSSDEDVATVEDDGTTVTVSALAAGTTTIKATASGYESVYDSFVLTVFDPIYKMVTSASQLSDGDSVAIGGYDATREKWYISGRPSASAPSNGAQYWTNVDNITLTNNMFHESDLDKGMTWTYNVTNSGKSFRDQYNSKYLGGYTSSNTGKCGESESRNANNYWNLTFNDNGSVRMVTTGSPATTFDYYYYPSGSTPEFKAYPASSYSNTSLYIFKSAGEGIPYSEVTTSVASLSMTEGNDASFTFSASPDFNTDTLTITSSNTNAATITVTGDTVSVHAVAEGTSHILFTNSAEETLADVEVTVNAVVVYDHIKVDASGVTKTYTIGDTISTAGTKVYAYQTKAETDTPVEVTSECTITANPSTANQVKDDLSVEISAVYMNGSKQLNGSDTVTVKVNPIYVAGVVLEYAKSTYEVGLSATPSQIGVTNPDATYKTLEVTSSDPDVIEVTNSETGALYFKAAGKATITASATDGSGKSASVELTSMFIYPIDRYINRDRISNLDSTYQGNVEVTSEFDGIAYITKDVMKKSSSDVTFQFRGNNGYLTNDTSLGGYISKITITGISGGGIKLYGSSDKTNFTEITTTDTGATRVYSFGDNNFAFFKVSASSSNALYLDTIAIEMKGDMATHLNAFADSFNNAVGDNCSNFSVSKWSTIEGYYNLLTANEKLALVDITVSDLDNNVGTKVDTALRRYDNIIANYQGVTDFIGRTSNSNANNQAATNSFGQIVENNISAIIIIAVSLTSITVIGGYFFLKKRREQN